MSTLRHLPTSALLCTLTAFPALAADATGCRDVAGLKRFEGSEIVQCDGRNFAEYALPLGAAKTFDHASKRGGFETKRDLEGRLVRNLYLVPPGPSSVEVFRNYKAELAEKGFTVLFEGKQGELGYWMGTVFGESGPGGQLLQYSGNEARYVAAEREADGVKTSLAIYVVEYADGYNPKLKPRKGQVLVRIDAVEAGELKQQMVVVSAAEIARGLDQSGKVALYGIFFDFNKASLQPQSRPTLDEIAKYLKANAAQKLHVVGHTDSVGGVEPNQKLSQDRAAAVVAELVKSYGVAPARLRPAGVGLLAPVATNATEDGRARNRRVELLPQ